MPDVRPIEDIIEEKRAALPPGGTPVTADTFKAWKERKEKEKAAETEAARQDAIAKQSKLCEPLDWAEIRLASSHTSLNISGDLVVFRLDITTWCLDRFTETTCAIRRHHKLAMQLRVKTSSVTPSSTTLQVKTSQNNRLKPSSQWCLVTSSSLGYRELDARTDKNVECAADLVHDLCSVYLFRAAEDETHRRELSSAKVVTSSPSTRTELPFGRDFSSELSFPRLPRKERALKEWRTLTLRSCGKLRQWT